MLDHAPPLPALALAVALDGVADLEPQALDDPPVVLGRREAGPEAGPELRRVEVAADEA